MACVAALVVVFQILLPFHAHFVLPIAISLALIELLASGGFSEIPKALLLDLGFVLLLLVEMLVWRHSSYRPNSAIALEHAAAQVALYFFLRISLRRWSQWGVVLIAVSLAGCIQSLRFIMTAAHERARLAEAGFLDPYAVRNVLTFGHFGHPHNEWITTYLALLPFAMALIVSSRGAARRASLGAASAALISTAILLSLSRGMYVAMAVFILVSIGVLLRYRVGQWGRLTWLSLGMPVLGLAIVAVSPFSSSVFTTIRLFATTSQIRSAQGRSEVWKVSTAMIDDRPVFGVGSRNFALEYARLRNPDAPFGGNPLNLLMQILVEKGSAGLLAYTALWTAFFAGGIRSVHRWRDEPERAGALVFLLSGMAALLVRDLTFASLLSNRAVTASIAAMAGMVAASWER